MQVRKDQVAVWLKSSEVSEARSNAAEPFDEERTPSLLVPWCKPPSKKPREILLPPSVARSHARPIKIERRAALLRSIARGCAWLEAVVSDDATVQDIAARNKCSIRHVNMTISMAFIAPGLVKAAIDVGSPAALALPIYATGPRNGRDSMNGSVWHKSDSQVAGYWPIFPR